MKSSPKVSCYEAVADVAIDIFAYSSSYLLLSFGRPKMDVQVFILDVQVFSVLCRALYVSFWSSLPFVVISLVRQNTGFPCSNHGCKAHVLGCGNSLAVSYHPVGPHAVSLQRGRRNMICRGAYTRQQDPRPIDPKHSEYEVSVLCLDPPPPLKNRVRLGKPALASRSSSSRARVAGGRARPPAAARRRWERARGLHPRPRS